MKKSTTQRSPLGSDSCSASSLADAVQSLNSTLKRHAEERSKELEVQLLKLEVTDLELQMLTLARKLRTAKEKLIAHYAAEEPQPEALNIVQRLERIEAQTRWNASKIAKEIGISRDTLYRAKAGTELGARNMKKLCALEARLFIPLNAGVVAPPGENSLNK